LVIFNESPIWTLGLLFFTTPPLFPMFCLLFYAAPVSAISQAWFIAPCPFPCCFIAIILTSVECLVQVSFLFTMRFGFSVCTQSLRKTRPLITSPSTQIVPQDSPQSKCPCPPAPRDDVRCMLLYVLFCAGFLIFFWFPPSGARFLEGDTLNPRS